MNKHDIGNFKNRARRLKFLFRFYNYEIKIGVLVVAVIIIAGFTLCY